MANGKPRLSIGEIKDIIENVKQYGGHHTTYIGQHNYSIDDVYQQYLDSLMGIMDEVILKKGR